jgi:hypothetical protein
VKGDGDCLPNAILCCFDLDEEEEKEYTADQLRNNVAMVMIR